jgi:hypothetical protein
MDRLTSHRADVILRELHDIFLYDGRQSCSTKCGLLGRRISQTTFGVQLDLDALLQITSEFLFLQIEDAVCHFLVQQCQSPGTAPLSANLQPNQYLLPADVEQRPCVSEMPLRRSSFPGHLRRKRNRGLGNRCAC